ncbi:MAG: P-type ATPase [Burkholderiaceae bacterium]|nr:MAG: P-type ATPase [Burkholderiaceae bacterium]
MKQSVYVIANMDCPTEETLIRKRLTRVPGIERLAFDLLARRLTVNHRLVDEQVIVGALREIGMDPAPARTLGAARHAQGHDHDHDHADGEHRVARRTWALMAVAGLAAAGAEVLAWSGASDRSPAVIALAVLSMLAGGLPTLRKGWIALKSFTLNINFLMSVAVLGAVAIGQWPEAAMVLFLFTVAELIESLSLRRAGDAIRGLLALAPQTATVRLADGSWHERDAALVQPGQTVRVRPGERIALDGVVVSGASSVNQAPITGESMPVDKGTGDTVFAGTVNGRGSFEFRVTAAASDTTLAHIIRSVHEAQSQRAPMQRFVDRFARHYTPAVVAIAVLVAVLPPLLFGEPFVAWLYKALVLLVIACPCALVISTPVTIVSALAAAARGGILIKGGVHLENGRLLKAIAIDKTGTLTHGRPVLTDVIALSDHARDELLQIAASVDAQSEHPVAAAIVAGSQDGPGRTPHTARSFEALAGRGAKAMLDGEPYHLGNHRLIEELGLCNDEVEAALEGLERQGKTAVVLASGQEALAVFGVADTLRGHGLDAVRGLQARGVHVTMLTGDNEATARAIATQVGITDVRGNLLPQHKLAAIDELRARHGAVGMVGDGINDAPALAQASIGFAMGAAGTDAAIEAADVALMDDDLRKLPRFIDLSRRTWRVLWQNITIALGIKAVFFALALAGGATLWMAVFADVGASLIVVVNGLRLLRGPVAGRD